MRRAGREATHVASRPSSVRRARPCPVPVRLSCVAVARHAHPDVPLVRVAASATNDIGCTFTRYLMRRPASLNPHQTRSKTPFTRQPRLMRRGTGPRPENELTSVAVAASAATAATAATSRADMRSSSAWQARRARARARARPRAASPMVPSTPSGGTCSASIARVDSDGCSLRAPRMSAPVTVGNRRVCSVASHRSGIDTV
jgi:hypothetical protein